MPPSVLSLFSKFCLIKTLLILLFYFDQKLISSLVSDLSADSAMSHVTFIVNQIFSYSFLVRNHVTSLDRSSDIFCQ